MTRVAASKPDYHRVTMVRAGFVAKGTSLHRWCTQNGLDSSNVHKTLTGKWVGPKASTLLAITLAAAGVNK